MDDVREACTSRTRCCEFSELCDDAVPELHVAAFADQRLAHERSRIAACSAISADGQRCRSPVRREARLSRCVSRRPPCRSLISQLLVRRRAPSAAPDHRCDVRSSNAPEAGLLVGADGARVGRIGIDDDARRAFVEQLVGELPRRSPSRGRCRPGPARRSRGRCRACRRAGPGRDGRPPDAGRSSGDRRSAGRPARRSAARSATLSMCLDDLGELRRRDRPTTRRHAARRASAPSSGRSACGHRRGSRSGGSYALSAASSVSMTKLWLV